MTLPLFACGRCDGRQWLLYPDGTVVCATANCKLVAKDLRINLDKSKAVA